MAQFVETFYCWCKVGLISSKQFSVHWQTLIEKRHKLIADKQAGFSDFIFKNLKGKIFRLKLCFTLHRKPLIFYLDWMFFSKIPGEFKQEDNSKQYLMKTLSLCLYMLERAEYVLKINGTNLKNE